MVSFRLSADDGGGAAVPSVFYGTDGAGRLTIDSAIHYEMQIQCKVVRCGFGDVGSILRHGRRCAGAVAGKAVVFAFRT